MTAKRTKAWRRSHKEWKRKNYERRKAQRVLKKRRRRKKIKKHRNIKKIRSLKPDIYYPVKAPSNFSLINQPDAVLGYFKECAKLLSKRKQVEFDLQNIESMTSDAIALLIAKVNDKQFREDLNVKGNKPEKKDLRKMFEDSGFLEHVSTGFPVKSNEKNLLIHKITDKKVENEIAKQVGILAVNHTFRSDIKFRPLYEILIECMANTNNHAGLNNQGKFNWWILVYNNPETKVTSISFLDLGIGIFNSIPMQTLKRKLLTKLKDVTNINVIPKYNKDFIPELFKGGIKTTRTGKSYRGKGLPLINKHSKNPKIKNFTIIANDVYVKIPEFEAKTLKHKLNGTFLYWELHP